MSKFKEGDKVLISWNDTIFVGRILFYVEQEVPYYKVRVLSHRFYAEELMVAEFKLFLHTELAEELYCD